MRITADAEPRIEIGADAFQELRIDGDAQQRIEIGATFQGTPIAVPGDEEIVLVIDARELFNNADSGTQRFGNVGFGNFDAHIFRGGGTQDRTYFSRPVPDSWQGETIQLYGAYSHNTAALTGAGSPPDDQVKIEIGYAVTADQIVVPDNGIINDGTAPNEFDDAFQIGATQVAPIWRLHGSIAIGASDRWVHVRTTRDGPDASEGSVGFLYNWQYALLLP